MKYNVCLKGLIRRAALCVMLSLMFTDCKPTGSGSNDSGKNAVSNRPCHVREMTFQNGDQNASHADVESMTRGLSTRTEGLVIHSETLMNKLTTALRSKFALDCVDSVTSYSVGELDCAGSSLIHIDEFVSCSLSAFTVMGSFSTSIDLINEWAAWKHPIVTHTDLTSLKNDVDELMCDVLVDVTPVLTNSSELMDFTPEAVRLVRDVTDSNSKASLADLIHFDNKKCGYIGSDINEIQDMHFMYQFLYDITETARRLHLVFSNTTTTSGSMDVTSSSSPTDQAIGQTSRETTKGLPGSFLLHMREIIKG